jgi:hypothetical protein
MMTPFRRRSSSSTTSDQHGLGLEQGLADDGQASLTQRGPGGDDVGHDLGDAEPDRGLYGAIELDDVGGQSALREVARDEARVGGRDAPAAEVVEGRERPGFGRVAEGRASEVEREHLVRGHAAVQQQVPAGDPDLDLALRDVGGDVPRAQVEELDVVIGVYQDEVASVGALAVSGFAEHDHRRLGQRALVRQSDAQHRRSS